MKLYSVQWKKKHAPLSYVPQKGLVFPLYFIKNMYALIV